MARPLPETVPATLRGGHVFLIILGFFAAFIAVDVLFIVRAVSTFPGEEVKNSYVLGLDYNAEVARKQKQATLGWRAEIGVEGRSAPMLVVRLAHKDDVGLAGLDVAARVHVFGSREEYAPIPLKERAAGEYVGELPVQAPVRLDIEIEAHRANEAGPVFEAVKTLVIP